MQRRERAGSEQRIARAPEHTRNFSLLTRKLLKQSRLADACLAGNERNDAAVFSSGIEPFTQVEQAALALEKLRRAHWVGYSTSEFPDHFVVAREEYSLPGVSPWCRAVRSGLSTFETAVAMASRAQLRQMK